MKLLTRLTMVLSFLVMFQNAYASNKIYVEQIGSGSIVDFTQTGSGNEIGNATTKAIVNGNNNTVTVEQIGNMNTQVLNVDGAANIVTNIVTGDNNTVDTNITGSTNTVTNTVTGDGNAVTQNITSSGSTSTVTITTDNNTVNINNTTTAVSGAYSSVNISAGGGNNVDITQAGAAGVNGHSAILTVAGATNTVDIKQGGSVDSTVNATITGSGNTLNINSNY